MFIYIAFLILGLIAAAALFFVVYQASRYVLRLVNSWRSERGKRLFPAWLCLLVSLLAAFSFVV